MRSEQWIKYLAGNQSMFLCTLLGKVFTQTLKTEFGAGPKRIRFFFHTGLTTGFVVQKEMISFGKLLSRKIEKNPRQITRWTRQLSRQIDFLRKQLLSFHGKRMTKAEFEKICLETEQFYAHLVPVMQVADYLPSSTLKKMLPKLEKARKYSESVQSEIEGFFEHWAEKENKYSHFPTAFFLSQTEKELLQYFKTHRFLSRLKLEHRCSCSALDFSNGKYVLFPKTYAEKLEEKTRLSRSDSFVIGQTAYPGKVIGTCRRVLHPADSTRFDEGDILVTQMTKPEYLPMIRKAGAIVTDAGGLLSHAGIICRELKKPSVIGTDKATLVFKTGEKLHVDATKGIVRKIL
ncbi:MAG: hypothetical protein J4215_05005 [Candidatus Diapherotrites archaeon]|uniref:PEP-utilising enzyme mobile domain-containing protein n=1 Tax=Candidatus Iainarchaeum sp. TaxID=3101447 RepID=A0A8T4L7N9_9ARCH|nr:hypothetical protein [Candidatus Diapherotrites archaeon]